MSGRDLESEKLETAEATFARAHQRGHQMGLPYAGALTPVEAHRLSEAGAATLVDVRTLPEWQFVGHVPGAPLIEWPRGGDAELMEAFLEQLQEAFEPSQPLLFLCRSGVRSHYAAHLAAQAGFQSAYNILEGFEGNPGANNGWHAAGLPSEKG